LTSRVLVTGGAGFIGSHICDKLIELGYEVICLDNLLTTKVENVAHLSNKSGFEFIEGDIRDLELLSEVIKGCTHVCHQAALGSVPRSIEDPIRTNEINLVGGLNVLSASKNYGIKRFVFASSSSVYGDDPILPKVESRTGKQLSPYAVSKAAFESYANVFNIVHGMETIGLRYFNVFGPRQSPEGAYAAVVPKFIDSIRKGVAPTIYGDGNQTRDFTYVDNVVDANIKSLFDDVSQAYGESFNVACGETITINRLFELLELSFSNLTGVASTLRPNHAPNRTGDVRDSLAELTRIIECIGYNPIVKIEEGIEKTVSWYVENEVI
jgi:UDP-N-acetylglucosamine 4-epimerase